VTGRSSAPRPRFQRSRRAWVIRSRTDLAANGNHPWSRGPRCLGHESSGRRHFARASPFSRRNAAVEQICQRARLADPCRTGDCLARRVVVGNFRSDTGCACVGCYRIWLDSNVLCRQLSPPSDWPLSAWIRASVQSSAAPICEDRARTGEKNPMPTCCGVDRIASERLRPDRCAIYDPLHAAWKA
jgi:hypothetical protein